jgi:hypothetical protein
MNWKSQYCMKITCFIGVYLYVADKHYAGKLNEIKSVRLFSVSIRKPPVAEITYRRRWISEWMNDHEVLVEWVWQGKSKYSGKKTVPASLSLTTNPTLTDLGSNLDLHDNRGGFVAREGCGLCRHQQTTSKEPTDHPIPSKLVVGWYDRCWNKPEIIRLSPCHHYTAVITRNKSCSIPQCRKYLNKTVFSSFGVEDRRLIISPCRVGRTTKDSLISTIKTLPQNTSPPPKYVGRGQKISPYA